MVDMWYDTKYSITKEEIIKEGKVATFAASVLFVAMGASCLFSLLWPQLIGLAVLFGVWLLSFENMLQRYKIYYQLFVVKKNKSKGELK